MWIRRKSNGAIKEVDPATHKREVAGGACATATREEYDQYLVKVRKSEDDAIRAEVPKPKAAPRPIKKKSTAPLKMAATEEGVSDNG